MPDDYRRLSALDHLGLAARRVAAPGEARLWLAERPSVGKINLRGRVADPLFRASVRDIAGIEPPDRPNRVTTEGARRLIWLGPDEWLLTLPEAEEQRLAADLQARLMGQHAAVTVVGDMRTLIALGGPAAHAVLAKLCPLDLHPRVFGVDDCAQSLVGRVAALIHQRSVLPDFDLFVDRSYAGWLWQRLEDAGIEYGVAVVSPPD